VQTGQSFGNCVLKDTGTVCLWDSSIISYRICRILDKNYMRQKDALSLRQANAIVDNCFYSYFSQNHRIIKVGKDL